MRIKPQNQKSVMDENGKVYLLAIDKAGLKSVLLGSQKAFFIFLDASIACVSEIK
jgi:hypothetical protein